MEIRYDERGLVPVVIQDWATGEVLTLAYANEEAVARTREAAERPEGSYTIQLLDDPELAGEKVEEEAEEVVRAVREETDDRVDEEAADVLYHLTVLLHSRGRALTDAEEVLNGR